MATAQAPNPRASLLAGLRTGGVRSASGPTGHVPQTAAPGSTSFNIPRMVSTPHNDMMYPTEEEDEFPDTMGQNLYVRNNASRPQQHPMTAAVDGAANRFSQQQGFTMNPMSYPFTPAAAQNQLQALQLQMMQMEIARLQNLQAQQYQAELIAQAQAQAQRQRQQTQPVRRATTGFVPPATAGPAQGSFDLRASALNAQMRRANQAEQLRAKLGVYADEHVPMTAALGGKFGSRVAPARPESDEDDFASYSAKPPPTPNYTTVISGGTSLGTPTISTAPSKSDAAISWRRGTTNNSVLNGNRAASSPMVKITPPPVEPTSPPTGPVSAKARPLPLQLSAAASQPMPAVAIDNSDGTDGDDSSSVSSKSNSSPSTPNSASSSNAPPVSPREEAVKKLYEGLGIGRPLPTITVAEPQGVPVVVHRLISQPVRQPIGPPSNNDDLRPRNFATRSRRKAIGALMDARERREVEAF
ncbi:hypothetical protein POSPLADRAFT_1059423 [Postia placenta MAD-698-R-SB12]|uniref:Uncharacterized protein n=1 Tax=Postia placenta MAD-698-R-SB12 TaxID=670580 RepID=A0A1X6MS61_9APHY|nr:hypothetical protein POSPLADRAFT_1059423 [Postia placenta MAD-698-R-SB12]OSX59218.1 hypothetical protein POSPLADRAFT_1059423 [Postia placenta MAD-698-R-SB12]